MTGKNLIHCPSLRFSENINHVTYVPTLKSALHFGTLKVPYTVFWHEQLCFYASCSIMVMKITHEMKNYSTVMQNSAIL